MQQTLLSIIIVNYNVKDFLNQALHSIEKAVSGLTVEIFVVDNASRDGSAAMIRENFPQVHLIKNDQNAGFAGANNQALKLCRGKYVLLINPDTLVQEDTFVKLISFLDRHPEAGMAGCKILNPDGSLQSACRRSIPTPWIAFTKLTGLSDLFPHNRWLAKYNLTYLDPDQTTAVDAISGSFMLVKREVVEQVGFLDEQFFMYGEDLDWCYRITRAGWKIYYVPTTKIVHYKGASTEKARLDTILTFYRVMLQFAGKHFKGKYLFFPQWFLIVGIGLRAAVSFLQNLFSRLRWPFVDLFFLNLSLLLAIILRFGSLQFWQSYILVTAIYSLVWLGSFFFFDLYDQRKFSVSRAAAGVILGLIINSTITYFAKNFAFSRLVVIYAGGINLLLIPGWRWGLKKISAMSSRPFFERLKKQYFRKEAIVVGDSRSVSDIIRKLNNQYHSDTDIVAALLTNFRGNPENGFAGLPVLGEVNELPWYIREYAANEVIFISDSIPYEKMLGLMAESENSGVEFKVASQKMEVIIGSSSVDYLGDISLIDLDYRLAHSPYKILKRAMDLLLSIFFLLLFVPVWPLLWLKGYRLTRILIVSPLPGKSVPVFSKPGRLPETFIEKLPLLFWVIKGDFSLVGEELRFETSEKKSANPVILLKPGLISFLRLKEMGPDQAENRKKIEIYYLKNYTPLFDLQLILRGIIRGKI